MDKKKAVNWVKALRSGKFKQGEGQLKVVNKNDGKISHCCLGVLAEISGVSDDFIMKSNSLSEKSVRKTCGLWDRYGETVGFGDIRIRKGNKFFEFESLAAANDLGVSFKSIASWIEKNYKRL